MGERSNYKLVFVAHPIRGDVEGNKRKVKELLGNLCRTSSFNYIFTAPYLVTLELYDDADPIQRARGIEIGLAQLERCDELWVFGQPTEGMKQEIEHASAHGVRVVFKEAQAC